MDFLPIAVIAVASALLLKKKKASSYVAEPEPEPIPDGGGDGGGGGGSGGGGSSEPLTHAGPMLGGNANPPSVGPSNKYSTGYDLRMALNGLGYTMEINNLAPPANKVLQFQENYNSVSSWVGSVKGLLKADGSPGTNTKNALYAASIIGKGWPVELIKAAAEFTKSTLKG